MAGWPTWKHIPTRDEFEGETKRGLLSHRSGELDRVGKALDWHHKARPRDAHDQLMALMDVDDAIVEWVANNPKESRNRNDGHEVNLSQGAEAARGPADKLYKLVRKAMGMTFPRQVRTFCCFNIGTAHAREEAANLLVRLFDETGGLAGLGDQLSHVNHGPGHAGSDQRDGFDPVGGLLGHGLARRVRLSVKRIMLSKPERVFLVGHSRGAILNYLIAHKLHEEGSGAKVSIFSVDPVAMTLSGGGNRNSLAPNVERHVVMAMENEGSATFPLTHATGGNFAGATPFVGDRVTSRVTQVMPMPGKHGSATQTNTPIGRLGLAVILRWLGSQGVTTRSPVPGAREVCDMFFQLHRDSPIHFKGGRAVGRAVQDGSTTSRQGFARSGLSGVASSHGRGGFSNAVSVTKLTEWQASPFFVNHYHEALFATHWPSVHKVLCTGSAGRGFGTSDGDWERRRAKLRVNAPASPERLSAELSQVRGMQGAMQTLKQYGIL